MATISVPLALSYDTRGVAAATNLAAGVDQRRVNCYYEILRGAMGANPTVILTKRPGVTVNASTFGASGQVQYLVGYDPSGTWDAAPWVITKDGSNVIKAHNSSTSTSILTDANFSPRFWENVRLGDNTYFVLQLQDTNTPAASSNSQKVYYSSAIGTFTQITDAEFTALQHRGKMEFMDGYAFIADGRNRIYQSTLNDVSSWPDTYIGRTVLQDPPQGLMKLKNHLVFFGEDTSEIFIDDPQTSSGTVLSRIPYSTQRIGLASVAGGGSGLVGKTSYYTTLGDMAFFLGRFGGRGADASLVSYDGKYFEKISRPLEDKILSSTTIYSVNRVSFGGKVAVAIQTTLPTASTQKWLMFFPDLNDWFEWESTIYGPVNNGTYYTGIDNEQKIYSFAATDKWQDDATNFTMTVQFRIPSEDYAWKTMPMCGVIADTTASQNLGVSFSDDDGTTWSTARNIDLSLKKKELTGCGGFRERSVRLTNTSSGEVRIRRFYASLSGTE